jgi:hypothetical protein
METLSVEASFDRLQRALNASPRRFEAVGGDVAFCVREAKPSWWQVTRLGDVVAIKRGRPAFPICTIGIQGFALSDLATGTLDVERAFRKRWLAVEGDPEALGRFVECFSVVG